MGFPLLQCAVAVFGLNPVTGVVAYDQVDLIEINHFHDDRGRHVFDQVIYFDWSPKQRRYNVRAWRLIKDRGQIPTYHHQSGKFQSVWHDGNVMRLIRGTSVRETWTQYDPEMVERKHLPRDQRRELFKPAATLKK